MGESNDPESKTSVMGDLEAFRKSKLLIFWLKWFLFPDYASDPEQMLNNISFY